MKCENSGASQVDLVRLVDRARRAEEERYSLALATIGAIEALLVLIGVIVTCQEKGFSEYPQEAVLVELKRITEGLMGSTREVINP